MLIFFKLIYVAMAAMFGNALFIDIKKHGFKGEKASWPISGAIGGIAYFLDTLGIGSFAPSTAMLRFFKQIKDKNLPGTLNVASVLPLLLEAFIFIDIIKVDPFTITTIVTATCIGAWLGASLVHKLPENRIRFIISVALFIAATVSLLRHLNLLPTEYMGSIGLTGIKLLIAILISIAIGTLGSFGIGCYAPFLALSLSLGLSARAMFPIMMSAAALGGGFASMKFIKLGNYERKSALAMMLVAMLGVIIAAYIVKTLPLEVLTWIVIGVIYYAAVTIFVTGYKKSKTQITNH